MKRRNLITLAAAAAATSQVFAEPTNVVTELAERFSSMVNPRGAWQPNTLYSVTPEGMHDAFTSGVKAYITISTHRSNSVSVVGDIAARNVIEMEPMQFFVDLLNSGAGLIGFDWAEMPADANKVSWALQTTSVGVNVLRYIPVADWVDLFSGTSTLDHSSAVQLAIDQAGIGGTVIFPKTQNGIKAKNLQCLDGQTYIGAGRKSTTVYGDGTAPVFKTNDWPSSVLPVRNVHFKSMRIKNENYNAIQLHGSPDSSIQGCEISVVGCSALSQILSVRCKINGNRILSSGDFYAWEIFNYANGLDGSGNIVSGGAAGNAIVIGRSATINIDSIVNEVGGGVGISAASTRALGSKFANGELVHIRAVKGLGRGATGTAVVSRGLLTAVKISEGGFGFVNGELVYIRNADNTQSWGAARVAVSAGTVISLIDEAGGNVVALSMRNYYAEQVRRPMELGLLYSVIGCDFTGAVFGNSRASNVSARDSAIHIGRAANVIADGFYPIGLGAEALFEFYDIVAGAGKVSFLQDSRISVSQIRGYSASWVKNIAFTSSYESRIFGKNYLALGTYDPNGVVREWISPTIIANISFAQTQVCSAVIGGGMVLNIDVIDKVGICTCTVDFGTNASVSEIASFNPELLNYTQRLANVLNEGHDRYIRPNGPMLFQTTAGVGTGTFRIRIRYRT